jgi:large subunit ribosomal protein L3
MKFILGKKLEMSQIFDEKGNVVPVTLIEAGLCQVTQVKTKERDGYQAVQIGFEKIEKAKKIKKTMKGKEFRYLKEFPISNSQFSMKTGDKIDVSVFKEGEKVNVSGISKGKGFAGVVKRWHFKGQFKTHGTKEKWRSPGSIGQRWPQRVIKGKKMGGRMGSDRTTVKNLKIAKIDLENNILAVRGAVPGRNGILLEIRSGK